MRKKQRREGVHGINRGFPFRNFATRIMKDEQYFMLMYF